MTASGRVDAAEVGDALFSVREVGADPDELRRQKDEWDAMGVDARRTIRNNRMIEAGQHPTTKRPLLCALPEDEKVIRLLAGVSLDATCGDCRHCETQRIRSGRSFVKCLAVPLTHGPGSDTRKKWPACTKFEVR